MFREVEMLANRSLSGFAPLLSGGGGRLEKGIEAIAWGFVANAGVDRDLI